MGRAARRALHKRTTASERLDMGFEMLAETQDKIIEQIEVPEDLAGLERTRYIARRLRGWDG